MIPWHGRGRGSPARSTKSLNKLHGASAHNQDFTGNFDSVSGNLAAFTKEFQSQGLDKRLPTAPTSILVLNEDPTGKQAFSYSTGFPVPVKLEAQAPLKSVQTLRNGLTVRVITTDPQSVFADWTPSICFVYYSMSLEGYFLGGTTMDFQGTGFAMTGDGLAAAGDMMGVHAAEVMTVLAVETKGCGFLPDRRPQILYERHIFHRLTNGQFDDGDISDPSPGGYGPSGAHQYNRLAAAIALNRTAALQSASWGVAQIMGENFQSAGFTDVESMVAAMTKGEDQQLTAMGNFLLHNKLNLFLRAHDWTSFARGYNGPNFAINRYDVQLNGEFQKLSSAGLPDLIARAAQLYLSYLGFDPGPIDGVPGRRTLAALAQFQTNNGLPVTNSIDAGTVTQLINALPQIASTVGA